MTFDSLYQVRPYFPPCIIKIKASRWDWWHSSESPWWWDGTTWTSFPSYQHYGRLTRRRSGSEPSSSASQCAACLSEHSPGAPTGAEKVIELSKKTNPKLDYYSRWRLDLTPHPGPQVKRRSSRSHVFLAGPERAEHPSVNHDRGKVECTTWYHPLFLSLSARSWGGKKTKIHFALLKWLTKCSQLVMCSFFNTEVTENNRDSEPDSGDHFGLLWNCVIADADWNDSQALDAFTQVSCVFQWSDKWVWRGDARFSPYNITCVMILNLQQTAVSQSQPC